MVMPLHPPLSCSPPPRAVLSAVPLPRGRSSPLFPSPAGGPLRVSNWRRGYGHRRSVRRAWSGVPRMLSGTLRRRC